MSPEEVAQARRQFELFIRPKLKTLSPLVERRGPGHDYNCHGLTFALRRAWLDKEGGVEMALRDDGYSQVPIEQALPGDVVLYRDHQGEPAHTGVVVQVDTSGQFPILWVLSKWGNGCEYVHHYDNCLYRGPVSFWRES